MTVYAAQKRKFIPIVFPPLSVYRERAGQALRKWTIALDLQKVKPPREYHVCVRLLAEYDKQVAADVDFGVLLTVYWRKELVAIAEITQAAFE